MTHRLRSLTVGVVAALAAWSAEPGLATAAPRSPLVIVQSEVAIAAKPLPGNPAPQYPDRAREAGVEGECVFRADVTPDGTVSRVVVLQVPQEGLGFEAAVEDAVAVWRFEPARRGTAKTTWVYVGKINYSLLSVNHGRMYSVSTSVAWEKLREWFAQTGIKTERVDRRHGLLLTKLIDVRSASVTLPTAVTDGYVPRRFQILVFVSPYAEPARVYVASLVQVERETGGKLEKRTVYNMPAPSTWLLREFSKHLGDGGSVMPDSAAARAALADQLRKDGSTPGCSPSVAAVKPTPPVKFFDVTPTYPARLLAERHRGQVRYEFDIQEDGAVQFSRFLDPADPADQPFLDATRAALAFWRFEPARLGGCPVLVIGTGVNKFDFK
jgi:TonB family protein